MILLSRDARPFGFDAVRSLRALRGAGVDRSRVWRGGGGGYRAYRARRYSLARRAKKNVSVASRSVSKKPVEVAKADPVAQPETVAEQKTAEFENSSITTEDKVAEAKAPEQTVGEAGPEKPVQKVAAVKDVGCKKFFPSVGMTLSVPASR